MPFARHWPPQDLILKTERLRYSANLRSVTGTIQIFHNIKITGNSEKPNSTGIKRVGECVIRFDG